MKMPHSVLGASYWSKGANEPLLVYGEQIGLTICSYITAAHALITQYGTNEAQKLMTASSVERICKLASEVSASACEVDESQEEALLIKQWVLLGSVTEAVLQVFLTVYLDDFNSERWQQWEAFQSDRVLAEVISAFDDLVNSGELTSKNRKSLLAAVKEKIKEHTSSHAIDKVMLDELISFYESKKIIDAQYIKNLRTIQRNRNCVHAYMDREIDDAKVYKDCLLLAGCMIQEFAGRLPDVSVQNEWSR